MMKLTSASFRPAGVDNSFLRKAVISSTALAVMKQVSKWFIHKVLPALGIEKISIYGVVKAIATLAVWLFKQITWPLEQPYPLPYTDE
jgi:hypothetical protein